MGHYEDFWYEITDDLKRLNLKKEFDAQLVKMHTQDKHQYKDTRERWRYAFDKVKKLKIRNGQSIEKLPEE